MTYDLRSLRLPRVGGGTLGLVATLLENAVTGAALRAKLLRDAGIDRLHHTRADEVPTYVPIHFVHGDGQRAPLPLDMERPLGAPRGFRFPSVADYARAYREGRTTPDDVARRLLDAIAAGEANDPPLRAVIRSDRNDVLSQARASTERWRAGRPLGAFDGVPVATKDEVDQVPYPTSVGTKFLGKHPARSDSTVVARMRAAGALLFGKTNMHEVGAGVTGLNIHHGTPRNPYAPAHHTGGSSSGSATAVAAGLCPVAIGADGGGSIRIPAALCGVFGLKPTFGRVSEYGATPLCWSVAHLGAITGSATDSALAYTVLAGPDPNDPMSLHQPPPRFDDIGREDLRGLVLGVYLPWLRHATAPIVSACEALLTRFRELGAEVRDIVIPELDAARIGHAVTIGSEIAAAMLPYMAHNGDFSPEIRVNLALGRAFHSGDYVQAQRIRTRAIAHFARALSQVNAIITPATAIPAPRIRSDALARGESDLGMLDELMRFAVPPNFTGHPAMSFPAGYDDAGLPLGVQAIGRPWEEHVLLRLALAAERAVERRKPVLYWNPLGG
ncbi:MAG TPA: amidase [Gemmatimonadaceae bacterium]|nr:amidase [Gemmatimonadaceae bacterium]